MSRGTNLVRAVLVAATLAGFLITPSTMAASESCEHRIERAEARLDRAIRDHGPDSREARARRAELRDVRVDCHVDRWSPSR